MPLRNSSISPSSLTRKPNFHVRVSIALIEALVLSINDITVPFITASAEPHDPFVAYARIGVEM